MDTDEWLTTGQTASMLGVSRQYVVDLCDRGELPCTRAGSHRRVRRTDVQQYLDPELTREQEKSLWLHRALLGPLMRDPQGVVEAARQNLRRWTGAHRSDGMSASYLGQWSQVLDDGVDDVVRVLTSTDDRSRELRQNSPFAGCRVTPGAAGVRPTLGSRARSRVKRSDLAHILRAACDVAGDRDVLVIGSQSILGAFDEDDLPPAAITSIEADIAFLEDPERLNAVEVEAAICEMSSFHQSFGIYAEGVHVETAAYLPAGWRDRLIRWPLRSSELAVPHFLEPHDLAVAKLGAHRQKDLDFVDALLLAGMLDIDSDQFHEVIARHRRA